MAALHGGWLISFGPAEDHNVCIRHSYAGERFSCYDSHILGRLRCQSECEADAHPVDTPRIGGHCPFTRNNAAHVSHTDRLNMNSKTAQILQELPSLAAWEFDSHENAHDVWCGYRTTV